MLACCSMRHVDGVCLVWSKVSRAMALVIIKFTQRHPCCWAAGHHYQSTTAQQPQPRKQYYHRLWILPSFNHHAVIRTPLCIPQQPWEPSPKSVLNSKQNYLPRLGKRVCPEPTTLDHSLLNTSSCLDHTVNVFADQPFIQSCSVLL